MIDQKIEVEAMQQDQVALNFFPLAEQQFSFSVYRTPYQQEKKLEGFADCVKHKLPLASSDAEQDEQDDYADYWVSFVPRNDFETYICKPRTNDHLAVAYLFELLKKKCRKVLKPSEYLIKDGFVRRIGFILEQHREGDETVWFEPYFLRAKRIFGFLADFEFQKRSGEPFSKRIQQLSLSLDRHFKENKNFYVDRFEKLQHFTQDFHHKLFPLEYSDHLFMDVKTTLSLLDAPTLSIKRYIFCEGRKATSQFKGIKDCGPLGPVRDNVLLYFVYRPYDKPLSYDLYRALRGDTYATFAGMKQMFGYELGQQHVAGVPVDDFDPKTMDRTIDTIKAAGSDRLVVPIVIVPWHKGEENRTAEDSYYLLKHRFLRQNLPTQLVSLSTLQDKNKLKWSISNIALGVFAKMGGHPWKVEPQTEKCLIIGIGQSHKIVDRQIKKYYAYSVLTDSSGLYQDLRVLSRSTKEDTYLEQLSSNLTQVLTDYADRFSKFAIHTTFSIRKTELEAIQQVIEKYSSKADSSTEFVVLKFNDINKFFGYSPNSNSMVPYESSFAQLSSREYLVWFEGLQYHNPNVYKRIGGPVHIDFIYPKHDLDEQMKRDYLQDALNLSGANWRGFNAKSLPVSIYYAHLVARYLREFDRLGLEEIELSNLTPWFL
jgi:hypothetical protein